MTWGGAEAGAALPFIAPSRQTGLHTELGEIAQHRPTDDDEQDQHDHRGQVDAAEIGHDTPERAVERLGDPIEHIPELADELIVGVDDVEGDQPRHHRLDDDDPPQDVEHDRQNIEQHEQKSRYTAERSMPY